MDKSIREVLFICLVDLDIFLLKLLIIGLQDFLILWTNSIKKESMKEGPCSLGRPSFLDSVGFTSSFFRKESSGLSFFSDLRKSFFRLPYLVKSGSPFCNNPEGLFLSSSIKITSLPEMDSGGAEFNLLGKDINDLFSISATKGLFPIGLPPPSMGDFTLKYLHFYRQFGCQKRIGS